jgi:hypothetical protein
MNQVVELGHLAIGIGQDREVHGGALRVVDVGDPLPVLVRRIDADRDRLDAALGEFAREGRRLAQLGGADRREVGRMGEQHDPGVPCPPMEVDRPFAGVLREVGGRIAESQACHGRLVNGWERRFCKALLR